MRQHSKQQGAALAVSLIMLVAMTILGVATLNGTRLAEKVSSNAQQKAIVFETAESVINSIASADDFQNRLFDSVGRFEPPPVPQDVESAAIADELDQTNTLGTSVDVNAAAEIQFCTVSPAESSDMSEDESDSSRNAAYRFDVRAVSTIDNSRARAAHVLRVEETRLASEARGDCPTPGT